MQVPADAREIDLLLSAQLIVAWAGERGAPGGEDRRLGWWRTSLVSEFGGHDLFMRLLPETWEWAALQGVREAARRHDAELRSQAADPDEIISLFRLGFEIDERTDERLYELKRAGAAPNVALPELNLLAENWDAESFHSWIQQHGKAAHSAAPIGRLIKGTPSAFPKVVSELVAALSPLPQTYPLPHFRRKK